MSDFMKTGLGRGKFHKYGFMKFLKKDLAPLISDPELAELDENDQNMTKHWKELKAFRDAKYDQLYDNSSDEVEK